MSLARPGDLEAGSMMGSVDTLAGERASSASVHKTTGPRLTVLSVAYPFAPAGPDAVGGAEQVLSLIDARLTAAGHRSLVVACRGSQAAGVLIPTPTPGGPLDDAAREKGWADHRRAILEALDRWPVDLVHLHGIDFHHYLPPPGVPVLVTLHLPPEWYPIEALRPDRPATSLHCVSLSQAARCPPGISLPVIENGVPLENFTLRLTRRRFALALGRICPEKGYHLALEAARLAGRPLLLAGQVFPYEAHQRYFDDELRPRLDAMRRFLGPVGLDRKRRLLSAARCLVIPSLVAETSSLVAMEALASGTPVVALPHGALPEIVDHGVTGFLVRDVQEMADAIEAAGELDPEACRAAARDRFSADRMVDRYLELYHRILREGAA